MRADKTLLEKKKDNLCSFIDQVLEDALDGEFNNYKITDIFEQLKDIFSEFKKTDANVLTLKIEIKIEE